MVSKYLMVRRRTESSSEGCFQQLYAIETTPKRKPAAQAPHSQYSMLKLSGGRGESGGDSGGDSAVALTAMAAVVVTVTVTMVTVVAAAAVVVAVVVVVVVVVTAVATVHTMGLLPKFCVGPTW